MSVRSSAVLSVVAVAAVLTGGAALFSTVRGSAGGAVASSQRTLRRDASFATGPIAARSMADISHSLLTDGRACVRAHGSVDPRCTSRLAAAGSSSVAAFALANCTQPAVYRVRAELLTELDGIVALDHHRRVALPPVTAAPAC